MDIMLIIEFILVFIFGWVLGQIYFAYKMHRAIKQIAEKYGVSLDNLNDNFNSALGIKISPMPELFTEYLNNSILLYDKNTGDFVCQGSDLQELASKVKEFKKIEFAKVIDKEQTVFFIDGKIETIETNESRTG